MIELIWDTGFKRAYKKRIAPDPELKDRFWSAMELFGSDPFAHALRTLTGKLRGCRGLRAMDVARLTARASSAPFHKLLISIVALSTSFYAKSQTTIPLIREHGVFVVPCTVNGLALKFIFDTGASDVSISLTEALFMLKNGYLSDADVRGEGRYRDATGKISVGTKIILRRIEFGGLVLRDVSASVVNEMDAPLLLGQSAMTQIGRFELDPAKATLTVFKGKAPSVKSQPYSAPVSVAVNHHYSGKVRVNTDTPILDQTDVFAARILGRCVSKLATIVRQENDQYYYVESSGIRGYILASYIEGPAP